MPHLNSVDEDTRGEEGTILAKRRPLGGWNETRDVTSHHHHNYGHHHHLHRPQHHHEIFSFVITLVSVEQASLLGVKHKL